MSTALEAMHWSAVAASEADDAEWEAVADEMVHELRYLGGSQVTATEIGENVDPEALDQLMPLMASPNLMLNAKQFVERFQETVFLPALRRAVEARIARSKNK